MAIFQLSESKNVTLLTGNDAHRSIIDFAHLLSRLNFPFYILSDTLKEEFLPFKSAVIDSIAAIPTAPDVIVNFNVVPEESYFVEEILEFYPDALFLISSSFLTATLFQSAISPEKTIVSFNGFAGLFPFLQTLEIAVSANHSAKDLKQAQLFFQSLGFKTETVEDRIGFVFPRILAMIINEAAFCVMENVATSEDIDIAMKLGTNYPKGPLEWADEIGLDVVVEILDSLYLEYGQDRYRACVLLKQYIRAGWLGKQNGRGFYRYDKNGKRL